MDDGAEMRHGVCSSGHQKKQIAGSEKVKNRALDVKKKWLLKISLSYDKYQCVMVA